MKEPPATSFWNIIRSAANRSVDRGAIKSSRGENLQTQFSVEPSPGIVSRNWGILGPNAAISVESNQKLRKPKGYQYRSDDLKMKANELELLFAAHKQKVPSDQCTGGRKGKVLDDINLMISSANAASLYLEERMVQSSLQTLENTSSRRMEFDINSLTKAVDTQDSSDPSVPLTSDYDLTDESKGMFYVKYMQKREEKLREELEIKRAEREAKMKAMQEALENNIAEMKTTFAVSRHPVLPFCQQKEEIVPYNSREDGSESGEDLQLHTVSTICKQDTGLTQETEEAYGKSVLDDIIKVSQTKKLLPNMPSYVPQNTGSWAGAAKSSSNVTGNQWTLGENPFTQSVPNFSDRKEKSMSASASAKAKGSARSKTKCFVHSRSNIEDNVLIEDDKEHLSQSLRKRSVTIGDLKDVSPIFVDIISLKPIRFPEEEHVYNGIVKGGHSKPFVQVENVADPCSEFVIRELVESIKTLKIEKDTGTQEARQFTGVLNYKEDNASVEASSEGVDIYADDNDKTWICRGPDKSEELEFENSNGMSVTSSMKDSSERLSSFSTHFNSPSSAKIEDYLEEENHLTWEPEELNPFPHSLEPSEMNASVYSQTGGSSSLDSNHSSHVSEADATRTRKKWGAPQRPFLESTTSQQSLKDVRRSFKRLLKFGRKGKGSDHLVRDCVSTSTTSEGDDDVENGHDQANRSSESLQKSRMGFLHSQTTDDSFQGQTFQQQESMENLQSSDPAPPASSKLRDHSSGRSFKAPRSIFSLTSFRNKGSEPMHNR